jgi:hypothetical protein
MYIVLSYGLGSLQRNLLIPTVPQHNSDNKQRYLYERLEIRDAKDYPRTNRLSQLPKNSALIPAADHALMHRTLPWVPRRCHYYYGFLLDTRYKRLCPSHLVPLIESILT